MRTSRASLGSRESEWHIVSLGDDGLSECVGLSWACHKHISKARPSSRMMVVPFAPECYLPILGAEDARKYFGRSRRVVEGLSVLWLDCMFTSPGRFCNVPPPTIRLSTDKSSRVSEDDPVPRHGGVANDCSTAVSNLQTLNVKKLAAQLSSPSQERPNIFHLSNLPW